MAAASPIASPRGNVREPILRSVARSQVMRRQRTRFIWPRPTVLNTGFSASAGRSNRRASRTTFARASVGSTVRIDRKMSAAKATMFMTAHTGCRVQMPRFSPTSAKRSAAKGV